MHYKGILLDIDNTLYSYKETHIKALEELVQYCCVKFNVTKEELKQAYKQGRKKVHFELIATASSHNRLLYIQKMLELLDINPLPNSLEIYNIYWNTFIKDIKVFDGVYMFLKKYKNNICIVTDLTAQIQYKKIKKLRFDKYINCIVSSEEAGKEKPHPFIFMLALQKLNLRSEDVCMIGDNYPKDVLGASNLGIKSIWINHEDKNEKFDNMLVTEVKSFNEILELV